MAEVTLIYKGSTIAEMDRAGVKTLQMAGTYCEDDLTIQWTNPDSSNPDNYIVVSYQGLDILSMNDSGTSVLKTAGLFCESDIVITYAREPRMIYNVWPGDFVAYIAGHSEYVPHYFERTYTLIGSTPAYSAGAVTTATNRSDGRSYTGPMVISDIQNGTWLHVVDTARPEYTTDVKVSNPITYNGRTYYYNESYGLYMYDPVQYQTIQDAVLSILQQIVI